MSIIPEKYKQTVTILSIDGGGIRGLIPALVLKELRKRIQRYRKNWELYCCFDLIAGTSTGALIGLGLTVPGVRDEGGPTTRTREGVPSRERNRVPALDLEQIVELYTRKGIEIFPLQTFRQLQNIRQAFAEKYDAGPLERILNSVFQDVTIQDALTNLLVTSYDTERRIPYFFKKRPAHYFHPEDLNFLMRDVARASSAAPTFFEPAHIQPVDGASDRFCLVDGAVFANNPALCAYIEARKMYPSARKFILLSLGTGSTVRRFNYQEMRNWGYLDWVSPGKGVPLFSMTTDGQSEAVNYQLNKLPGVEYYRIDAPLTGCSELIDDASRKNIDDLFRLAYRMIRKNESVLDIVAHRVTRKGIL